MQVQRQIDRLLAQRAAEWIETLKDGDEQDREAFVQWLRQSKLHVEQYLEMAAIDQELRALASREGEDVDALLRRVAPNVVRFNRNEAESTEIARSRRHIRWKTGAALAAGLVLCIGVVSYLQQRTPAISTAIGEQRTLTLADGSVLTLNTLSKVDIKFSRELRQIELKSGEAIFKVAADPARPFVVLTPSASVRALGTQFNVYQRSDGATVSVVEGRVQVARRPHSLGSDGDQAVQNLSAGEEAEVRASGEINKRVHADIDKAIAWRERRLFFEETPLDEIAQEFNRYGKSLKITLEGIEPGSRRYGGIFDADDPNSLAELLSREPDLLVERRDDKIVVRLRK